MVDFILTAATGSKPHYRPYHVKPETAQISEFNCGVFCPGQDNIRWCLWVRSVVTSLSSLCDFSCPVREKEREEKKRKTTRLEATGAIHIVPPPSLFQAPCCAGKAESTACLPALRISNFLSLFSLFQFARVCTQCALA